MAWRHTHRHTFCSFNLRFPSPSAQVSLFNCLNWSIRIDCSSKCKLCFWCEPSSSLNFVLLFFKATILNFWTEDGIIRPWNAHNVTSTFYTRHKCSQSNQVHSSHLKYSLSSRTPSQWFLTRDSHTYHIPAWSPFVRLILTLKWLPHQHQSWGQEVLFLISYVKFL